MVKGRQPEQVNSEQENKEMIGEKVKKITLLWKYIALNVFHRAN